MALIVRLLLKLYNISHKKLNSSRENHNVWIRLYPTMDCIAVSLCRSDDQRSQKKLRNHLKLKGEIGIKQSLLRLNCFNSKSY